MLSEFKTEIVGISAEVAIADAYGVTVNEHYRCRADERVVSAIANIVSETFEKYSIPKPTEHVAEKHNPVDFILEAGKTLSVKSNQRALGKVAPAHVGQVTPGTYFQYFEAFYPVVPTSDAEKRRLFKTTVIQRIDEFICVYWENIFDCDYLIHFYNILTQNKQINPTPSAIVFNRRKPPEWKREGFTFTRDAERWNESSTVKYCGVTIGEFQVHNNRENYKFRFKMDGIRQLLNEGVI
jgi:hypothetical protein